MACISFSSPAIQRTHNSNFEFKFFKVSPIYVFFISKLTSTIKRIKLCSGSEHCTNIMYMFPLCSQAVPKINIAA